MQDATQLIGGNYLQILDTLLAAVIVYYVLLYIRGTKTAGLMAGVMLIGVLYFLCQHFKLITLVFILEKVLVFGSIALIFVFAPEIRQIAERTLKRSHLLGWLFSRNEATSSSSLREELRESMQRLAERRVGALVILEKDDPVDGHIVPGTRLDAIMSDTFLVSLFEKHMPLHDGAVLVRDERIHSAANFLPISENPVIPQPLGTRHRAALGLTERCDAIVLVVSEETGAISIAFQGRLAHDLSPEQFDEQLSALIDANENFVTLVPRATMI